MVKKKEHPELNFCVKVIRNCFLLTGLYFVSVWASSEALTWVLLKPLAIFAGSYIFTELANHYGLKPIIPKTKKGGVTLIL